MRIVLFKYRFSLLISITLLVLEQLGSGLRALRRIFKSHEINKRNKSRLDLQKSNVGTLTNYTRDNPYRVNLLKSNSTKGVFILLLVN